MSVLSDMFEAADREERRKAEHPLAEVDIRTIKPAAIKDYLDTALIEQGEKGVVENIKDIALLPWELGKKVVKGVASTIREGYEDPRTLIAPALQTVGAAAGAITGNPLLAVAGSVAGRGLGEAIESYTFNRPLLNAESALETATAGFGSVTGTFAGGAIRGRLRAAGKLGVEKSLAPTTIDQTTLKNFDPDYDPLVHTWTKEDIAARRAATYKEVEEAGLKAPIYSYRRLNPDGTRQTIGDVVRFMVDEGHSFHEASTVALQHELLDRKRIDEVERIVALGSKEPKETARINAELARLNKNFDIAKEASLEEPKMTRAQQLVRRGIEAPHALAEELSRLNDTDMAGLPDYLHQTLEQFRRVTDVMPEATKHPLVTEVQKITGIGLTGKTWRPQTMLRKDNNPYMVHVADTAVDADALHERLVNEFGKRSQKFFADAKLTDADKVYLQTIENKPELFRALQKIDRTLPLEQQHAQLIQLQKDTRFDADELPQLHRGLDIIRSWQKEIGDPLYTIAVDLAKDAGTLPPVRPNYFTSTFTFENQLDELRGDLELSKKLYEENKGTGLGERYLTSMNILQNKIAVAEVAIDKRNKKLQTLMGSVNRGRVLPKALFAPALVGKKTQMGIGLNPEEASMAYIRSVSKKVIYDRALETGDQTIRAFMRSQIDAGANPDAVQGVARYMQNYLLDQVGTRRTVALENMKNTLASHPLTAKVVPHLEQAIKGISSFHYLANIALKPSFYVANSMQNFLTLFPLVDTESFSHGWARAIFDREKAYKEAVEAGALDEGMNKLWREDPMGRAQLNVVDRTAQNLGLYKPSDASEAFNRVVAYHAGKHNAEINGLSGYEAMRKGIDVVAETNFLNSAAHRPQVFNTPIPAMVLRYKTFGQNYGNFLGNLARKGEYQKLGTALAAVFAVSGTTGIPLYTYVQSGAAKAGVVLPDINPLEQVTGFEIQGVDPPMPLIPTDTGQAIGPFGSVLQSGLDVITGRGGDEESNVAKLTRGVIGTPLSNVLGGVAETLRGGKTYTASGKEIVAERTPAQIAAGIVGFGPSIKQEQYKTRRKVGLGVAARDVNSIKEEIKRSARAGVRNQKQIIQQAKGQVTRGSNRTVLGELLGYGRRAR